jgi:hypothetical protein
MSLVKPKTHKRGKLNNSPDLVGLSDFHYQQAVEADEAYSSIGVRNWQKCKGVIQFLIRRRDAHLKWHALLNNAIRDREEGSGTRGRASPL